MKPQTTLCMLAAALLLPLLPATAQEPDAALPRVPVPHRIELTQACPDALKELPVRLYPAWRELDRATDVRIDFKLTDGRPSEIRTVGRADYNGHIRHAVRSMQCQQPAKGEGTYAVSFRVSFRYPEDGDDAMLAMQIVDLGPALAALDPAAEK